MPSACGGICNATRRPSLISKRALEKFEPPGPDATDARYLKCVRVCAVLKAPLIELGPPRPPSRQLCHVRGVEQCAVNAFSPRPKRASCPACGPRFKVRSRKFMTNKTFIDLLFRRPSQAHFSLSPFPSTSPYLSHTFC